MNRSSTKGSDTVGRVFRATQRIDPLALSTTLSAIRVRWGRLLSERELLGQAMSPEKRKARGRIDLEIAKLRKKDFQLRQLCFNWGLDVRPISDSDIPF